MSEQALQELSAEQAVLRERMNTHQALHESSMDRLRTDIARRDAARDKALASFGRALDELGTDWAKFRAEMAKRDAARDAEMTKFHAEMAKRDAETAKRDAARDAEMTKFHAEMAKRDAEMAKRDAAREVEMAKRDADMAKRDKNNFYLNIAILFSAVVVANVIVGWLS